MRGGRRAEDVTAGALAEAERPASGVGRPWQHRRCRDRLGAFGRCRGFGRRGGGSGFGLGMRDAGGDRFPFSRFRVLHSDFQVVVDFTREIAKVYQSLLYDAVNDGPVDFLVHMDSNISEADGLHHPVRCVFR